MGDVVTVAGQTGRVELSCDPPQVDGLIASGARAATVHIVCRCDTDDCWALEREIRLTALECLRKEEIRV